MNINLQNYLKRLVTQYQDATWLQLQQLLANHHIKIRYQQRIEYYIRNDTYNRNYFKQHRFGSIPHHWISSKQLQQPTVMIHHYHCQPTLSNPLIQEQRDRFADQLGTDINIITKSRYALVYQQQQLLGYLTYQTEGELPNLISSYRDINNTFKKALTSC